jgi:hypothetical protein
MASYIERGEFLATLLSGGGRMATHGARMQQTAIPVLTRPASLTPHGGLAVFVMPMETRAPRLN